MLKQATINHEKVDYIEPNILVMFEMVNYFEDLFYSKTELGKLKNLSYQDRLDKLQDKFQKLATDEEKCIQAMITQLMDRDSRTKLLNLLNLIYVDVSWIKINTKTFLQYFEHMASLFRDINISL